MSINDPIFVVAITDLILAVEGLYFAFLLSRFPHSIERSLTLLLFTFLSIAAFLGALFHGFFPLKETTFWGWNVWIATTAAIGLNAVTLWTLSGVLLFGRRALSVVGLPALALFAGFLWWVTNIDFHYQTVVYFYAPALLVFALVTAARYFKGQKAWGTVCLGVLVSVAAAGVQTSTINIGMFDHNALYHILQAIALLLLYLGFRTALPSTIPARL